MDDRLLGALQALEGPIDQRFARLGEDLNGDIIGNDILLDQAADEIEVGLRGGGKSDLDLLEAHLNQRVEHAPLARPVHGIDQSLVAVAQVDGAPDRRLGDGPARPLPVRQVDRREGLILFNRHLGHGLGFLILGILERRLRSPLSRAGGGPLAKFGFNRAARWPAAGLPLSLATAAKSKEKAAARTQAECRGRVTQGSTIAVGFLAHGCLERNTGKRRKGMQTTATSFRRRCS